MKKWFIYVLICNLVTLSYDGLAQRTDIDTNEILQLSGVVVSEQDLTPMPYITVYDKSIGRGVRSCSEGMKGKIGRASLSCLRSKA